MKIVINKNEFINSISVNNRALAIKSPLPILECIFIEAKENNDIIFTTTNNNITIKKNVNGKVLEKGKIAIEGVFLQNIIREMPDGDIYLNVDKNNNCTIDNKDKIKQDFMGKSGNEYPEISVYDKDNYIRISEYNLKNLIEKSIVTVSKNNNEENKVLNGIYFEIENDDIKVTAIDGYKISIIKQKLKEKSENKISSIIPWYTLDDLNKIIKGDIDKEVLIYFGKKNVAFEFDKTILISNIIAGNYINTKTMTNLEYNTKVKINKNKLIESIKRSKAYTDEINKKPVIFNIEEQILNIKLDSMKGSYNEDIDIEKTGNELNIAFHHDILNILNVIDDEEIYLYFIKSKDPMIIKDKNETYYYLILSSNIN